MFNKTLSLLMTICLLATANLFVSGQTQSFKAENFQQQKTLSQKDFYNSSERANELLDKDSFIKVKKDSLTAKAMQDADKAQQKKKYVGMNTTTAIIIGAAIAAAIIIVLAAKHNNDYEDQCRTRVCPTFR